MHCDLVIIAPPEADYFSFAVACIPACGAAQRQMKIIYFSAIFAARVPLKAGRAVTIFLNLFTIVRYIMNTNYKEMINEKTVLNIWVFVFICGHNAVRLFCSAHVLASKGY
jgi:hypothetical protein